MFKEKIKFWITKSLLGNIVSWLTFHGRSLNVFYYGPVK